MATSTGKTYHTEDYRNWTIVVCRKSPREWEGFARPPGDPRGPFTRTTGTLMSKATALIAIRTIVDDEDALIAGKQPQGLLP